MSTVIRYALSFCMAIALLSGCGGSQSPIGGQGLAPQSIARPLLNPQQDDNGSWMSADAAAQDLLYVTDYTYVKVFTYPQLKRAGTLTGFGSDVGECVDSKGDVFVTNQLPTRMYEYAHGGTRRIATLKTHVGPVGCAIDPVTGDLAVAGFTGSPPGPGVDIFKGAKGKPSFYRAPQFYVTEFCTYDSNGDLFVDGPKAPSPNGDPELAELRKGSRTFFTIKLNEAIYPGGAVQWHRKYLAIEAHVPPRGSEYTPVIYEFAINGAQGRKVGTTILGSPAYQTFQFFISQGTLIVPNWDKPSMGKVNTLFYKYPAGGAPTMILTKGVASPRGVVISRALRADLTR